MCYYKYITTQHNNKKYILVYIRKEVKMSKTKKTELLEQNYVGVDVGNAYTKTGKVRFSTKVRIGEKLNGVGKSKKDVHSVVFNGENYVVGEGSIFTTEERYFSTQYSICLLTAIALRFPEQDFIDVTVCVGLPFKRHKHYAARLAATYNGKQFNIEVNSKEYTIRINAMEVFVEGALPILTENTGKVITIDVGGETTDVTQFNNLEIEAFDTYPTAMNSIYADVCDYLSNNDKGDFLPYEVEKFFNKTKIRVDQKEVDISGIRNVIQQSITELASIIKNKFDIQNADEIIIIGGGGMDTYTYWKNEFKTATLQEDSQFINSLIYEQVAKEVASE